MSVLDSRDVAFSSAKMDNFQAYLAVNDNDRLEGGHYASIESVSGCEAIAVGWWCVACDERNSSILACGASRTLP